MLMWPRVGDVWEDPHGRCVYLVVDIARGYAWAILLTGPSTKLIQFHRMEGPIGLAWRRVIAGEEA